MRMTHATNILRFVLDSICFLQGYLNNPINNMKIALPTDHVSHMAKRTHLWKAQCTYPRNKYFLTYRNVLISKLQTALIFSIVISVPYNEYSATAVFASYVVLLHAVKVVEFYCFFYVLFQKTYSFLRYCY